MRFGSFHLHSEYGLTALTRRNCLAAKYGREQTRNKSQIANEEARCFQRHSVCGLDRAVISTTSDRGQDIVDEYT